MPSSWQARMTRTAISPRLAIRILVSTGQCLRPGRPPVPHTLPSVSATRFQDVRWVPSTGSTNTDVLELARAGAPEGLVVVADHQTAGRGRRGRSWEAPAGAALMGTILLRPPAAVAGWATAAVGLAAVDAITAQAGVAPALKWPNDLVWPGDRTAPDRKLAGILAEADWHDDRVAVAVGIGINVAWGGAMPEEL